MLRGHADRITRTVLIILGFCFVAIGGAIIAANTGVFASGFPSRTLLENPAVAWIGGHSTWFWPIAAAALTLIGVFSLFWFFAVLRPPRKSRDISIDGTARTTLGSAALRDALTNEIQSYRGVENAKVRVYGDPVEPRLGVRVNLTHDARVAEVRDRIEHQALAHAREALDAPELPVILDLGVTGKSGARVE
ncbi:alkaline shock response membrane anchor protein AmaP [Asanoa sp. WMMD1127]|uniref:alkaline shock response membrane anchor protein AmaP n=1 Tax=Asanoa sp. WMMD1127 TaxID=3016107 RepID=UPI002415CEDC|nr:alkaline shock response membrane anchor protein AmaP [Asanoa sp. WMMD1127]MDG4825907.1 alkaline shock response membrane anchor protein AmaP [Asanoa sp. WMMD1127]